MIIVQKIKCVCYGIGREIYCIFLRISNSNEDCGFCSTEFGSVSAMSPRKKASLSSLRCNSVDMKWVLEFVQTKKK